MQTTKEAHYQFNQEVRDRHDVNTWLSEVLDGRMRTEFFYDYDPHANELYAEDGSALGEIFDTALADSERIASERYNLAFEVRRREAEKSEYEDMLAMMNGGSNTMIVVSDFPEELMDSPEDVGGYNVTRKQTMLRIITRGEDDRLSISSMSLDGSNRQALENIYDHFGLKPEPGELLGQRIYEDLDPYQMEFLEDQLMGIYDRSMSEQFGGQWKAGRRQPDNPMNTYDFVLAQEDIINYYLSEKDKALIDDSALKFAIAAEMERRWANSRNAMSAKDASYQQIIDINELPAQLAHSAQMAREAGKTFSGCGVSLSSSKDQLKELGFGNSTDDEETRYSFNKWTYCRLCQKDPKKKEKESKKMCGPCDICRDCDPNG